MLELLADDLVDPHCKRDSLRLLADARNRIAENVASRLGEIAVRIARRDADVHVGLFGPPRDAAAEAAGLALAIRAIDTAEAAHLLCKFAQVDSTERASAAYLAAQLDTPTGLGLAMGLSIGPDHRVRSAAANAVARALVENPQDPIAREMFNAALNDPGTSVPTNIASALADIDTPTADALLEPRSDHISATVRKIVSARLSSR